MGSYAAYLQGHLEAHNEKVQALTKRIAELQAALRLRDATEDGLKARAEAAEARIAALEAKLSEAEQENARLREVVQRAVAGLTRSACYTCGAEPGCNIDCAGCVWVSDAERALAALEEKK